MKDRHPLAALVHDALAGCDCALQYPEARFRIPGCLTHAEWIASRRVVSSFLASYGLCKITFTPIAWSWDWWVSDACPVEAMRSCRFSMRRET